jgi:diaminohydroxyphosphoribosylaminopyrimidine deaminase/5-amino-6-(5-phosphoribosylamino)uracil reductase
VSQFTATDHRLMARALDLAALGLCTTDPNPRVGCVIACGETIIGEGWHERAGQPHAEVLALRAAGESARGATAYVTLEPCSHHGRTPPCIEPLITARIGRVVCAMTDPNPRVLGSGIAALRAAGITVDSGLMEAQAAELNPGFISRMTRGLPWVRVKLAASLDGRTALANGESRWITGEAARRDVQHWRARSSAILTGSGTVVQDDPRLDVRDASLGENPRQPWRVVADSDLRTSRKSRVYTNPATAIVFTSAGATARDKEFEAHGIRVETVPRSDYGVDLRALLVRLADLQMNEVWVEGGSRLSGALLQEGLVDEVVIYLAPQVLGASARGMFDLPELHSLDGKVRLRFTDVRFVGDDLRLRARPAV